LGAMGKGITAIGSLDRRIIIEQPSTTTDEFGQEIETWSTLATVWAAKMIKPRLESMEDDQRVGGERATWQVRFTDTISRMMRVKVGSDYYTIKAIEEIKRENRLNLITELKDNNHG